MRRPTGPVYRGTAHGPHERENVHAPYRRAYGPGAAPMVRRDGRLHSVADVGDEPDRGRAVGHGGGPPGRAPGRGPRPPGAAGARRHRRPHPGHGRPARDDERRRRGLRLRRAAPRSARGDGHPHRVLGAHRRCRGRRRRRGRGQHSPRDRVRGGRHGGWAAAGTHAAGHRGERGRHHRRAARGQHQHRPLPARRGDAQRELVVRQQGLLDTRHRPARPRRRQRPARQRQGRRRHHSGQPGHVLRPLQHVGHGAGRDIPRPPVDPAGPQLAGRGHRARERRPRLRDRGEGPVQPGEPVGQPELGDRQRSRGGQQGRVPGVGGPAPARRLGHQPHPRSERLRLPRLDERADQAALRPDGPVPRRGDPVVHGQPGRRRLHRRRAVPRHGRALQLLERAGGGGLAAPGRHRRPRLRLQRGLQPRVDVERLPARLSARGGLRSVAHARGRSRLHDRRPLGESGSQPALRGKRPRQRGRGALLRQPQGLAGRAGQRTRIRRRAAGVDGDGLLHGARAHPERRALQRVRPRPGRPVVADPRRPLRRREPSDPQPPGHPRHPAHPVLSGPAG